MVLFITRPHLINYYFIIVITGEEMAKTVLIANQKGGIGKTTTATAMAQILNDLGHKTLLIDADMQRNATDTYRAEYEGVATLYDVLFEGASIKDTIQHTEIGDIVASDPLLREAEMKLGTDMSLVAVLGKQLKTLDEYEYIIIDTAPSLGNLLFACIRAADSIIIPTTTDRYAIQGLADLSATITKVEDTFGKVTPIDGILIVKYTDRSNLSKGITYDLEEFAKSLNTKVYKTKIREAVKLRESQAVRESLIKYAPHSKPAVDYKDWVYDEFLGEE